MKSMAGMCCILYGQNRSTEGLFIGVGHSMGVLLRKAAGDLQLLAVVQRGGRFVLGTLGFL